MMWQSCYTNYTGQCKLDMTSGSMLSPASGNIALVVVIVLPLLWNLKARTSTRIHAQDL